ncbi:hypothetical protein QYE76_009256 [Lolium multiflorum]|uniref:F-box domain-containing protein n=1 Tax=Lolium multiflorum TaxID=4521 RepID=A0AAD8TV31_LOLMU|nr:hypothetical protein QYE76_009256 [Lolium multiflorum]
MAQTEGLAATHHQPLPMCCGWKPTGGEGEDRSARAAAAHHHPCRPPSHASRRGEPRDTRDLFDGMPLGSRNEIASTESGPDLISALPDEAIHHVLGFLPAEEAVRTSVLARGWRHHWKSMHSLHISSIVGGFWYQVPWMWRLVDRVLLNRHVPLDECHINIDELCEVDDAEVQNWITHAVSECYVRVLIVDTDLDVRLKIGVRPIVSGHLKRLDLHNILLEDEILDLSCCGVLGDLRLFYFYGSECRRSDDKCFNCGICEDCSASEDENDGYMLLGGFSFER